ncbi:FtsB family cell division protein [Lysinibacillus sp. 54212]|uniref:FtsB family cell division protein n=1 Tax=Lysinibacillus sp. 54212 TaxID=3119829 RepID=UPI002FC89170
MAKRQQREIHKGSVKTLDNDYVRSNTDFAKSQYEKKQKVLRSRRMLVFFVFAAIVLAILANAASNQKERLAEKEEKKAEVLAELEAVKEQQAMLNLQITKLEDDEYIAKLARKEYFLSEEGEIIFTIPTEDKEQQDEKQ